MVGNLNVVGGNEGGEYDYNKGIIDSKSSVEEHVQNAEAITNQNS